MKTRLTMFSVRAAQYFIRRFRTSSRPLPPSPSAVLRMSSNSRLPTPSSRHPGSGPLSPCSSHFMADAFIGQTSLPSPLSSFLMTSPTWLWLRTSLVLWLQISLTSISGRSNPRSLTELFLGRMLQCLLSSRWYSVGFLCVMTVYLENGLSFLKHSLLGDLNGKHSFTWDGHLP